MHPIDKDFPDAVNYHNHESHSLIMESYGEMSGEEARICLKALEENDALEFFRVFGNHAKTYLVEEMDRLKEEKAA